MPHSSPLRGRVAVITGASSGIGRACALELASMGANLVVNARRAERLDSLVGEINARAGDGWGRAVGVAGDCVEQQVIASLFGAAQREFGKEADLVVVNAGARSPLSSDDLARGDHPPEPAGRRD